MLGRGTCRRRRRGVIMGPTADNNPLATARRHRLLAAMAAAGIDEIVAYGNGWQGDYLRYVSDFGILEGHGIAVVAADGATEPFLASATDADRASPEAPGVASPLSGYITRTALAQLARFPNHR